MEAKMEIKFNRKNESTVERFIYRYRLPGFLLQDCRNDNPAHLIQHNAYKFLFYKIFLFFVLFGSYNGIAQSNPPITPKWALGHVVWEDSINRQESAELLVKLYKEYNIPVGGIIIDSPWSLSYNDFNWNTDRYPEPDKMLQGFSERGIRAILWMTGCINSNARDVPVGRHPDYEYAFDNKFVINNGVESEWWKGSGMHLDFTNPEAVKWWDSMLDKVYKGGVSGWKVDQGEHYFGDSVLTSIGKIPIHEFKHYYYDHMYDYTQAKNNQGIILARPYSHQGEFAARPSKLSLGWSGDFEGNYEGLKLQIDNIYRSAEGGFGALACEICGFYEARSTKTQLIRYAQFGTFTACMINGGENGAFTNHLPWCHDEETTEIYRYYVNLHYQLVPYIFSTLVDVHLEGGALLKETSKERFSHKFGKELFFKAIVSDTNKTEITLPDGDDWIDFWSGKVIQGGTVLEQTYSLMQAPIFVRAGAIIPMDVTNNITGFGTAANEGKNTILIYPKGKSQYTFHKPLGDGTEYKDIKISYDDKNGLLTVNNQDTDEYIFNIKKDKKPEKVTGGDTWSYDKEKGFLQIEKSGDEFSITIK
jgi:alpha-glucosidase (family GH31 glycosyl hydrolase)